MCIKSPRTLILASLKNTSRAKPSGTFLPLILSILSLRSIYINQHHSVWSNQRLSYTTYFTRLDFFLLLHFSLPGWTHLVAALRTRMGALPPVAIAVVPHTIKQRRYERFRYQLGKKQTWCYSLLVFLSPSNVWWFRGEIFSKYQSRLICGR